VGSQGTPNPPLTLTRPRKLFLVASCLSLSLIGLAAGPVSF